MKKVSIIVPAYNSAITLTNTVARLVNQTLQDIEIVIVNDASTDNTWDIMLACEAAYPEKVIIINSEVNRGPGGARNIALEYVSGEYIGFVDSDDIVTLDMYEKMYNKAKEQDYDIVDCGFYKEKEDYAIIYTSDDLTGTLDDNKREKLIVAGGYFCTKIFKRELLINEQFKYREKAILEDCETLMYLFATAGSIGNVKEILYNYKYYEKSESNRLDGKQYVNNLSMAIDAVYEKLSPLDNYEEIKKAVEYSICQMASYALIMCVDTNLIMEIDQLRMQIKKYISINAYENEYITTKIDEETFALLKTYGMING